MSEKRRVITGADLNRTIDILQVREAAYNKWAGKRARGTLNDFIVNYLPHATVIMAAIFYFLSASHTVALIQMIVPTEWAKAAPIAFELGVVVIAALRQKTRKMSRWVNVQSAGLLYVLLLMGIVINVAGGFLSVLDFAAKQGDAQNINGLTIQQLMGQFGGLPAAYQVVFPLAVMLGVVIPFMGKYTGEMVIKLATGEIILHKEAIEDAWGREGWQELKSALYQAALKAGAASDIAGAWSKRTAANLLSLSNPSSDPVDAVSVTPIQTVSSAPVRAEFGFAQFVSTPTSAVSTQTDAQTTDRQQTDSRQAGAGYTRVATAVDIARQWLADNPDKADLPVRQLAEMIGVGKDSVAKAKKEIKGNGA